MIEQGGTQLAKYQQDALENKQTRHTLQQQSTSDIPFSE